MIVMLQLFAEGTFGETPSRITVPRGEDFSKYPPVEFTFEKYILSDKIPLSSSGFRGCFATYA